MLQYVNLSTMLKRNKCKGRSAVLEAINSEVQEVKILSIWFHASAEKG